MREYCLQARAKVNLTVDVLRRRADGYHEVDLLMQSVSLCDTLRLREAENLELTIEGALRPDPQNLILRAARLLAEDAGIAPRAKIARTCPSASRAAASARPGSARTLRPCAAGCRCTW